MSRRREFVRFARVILVTTAAALLLFGVGSQKDWHTIAANIATGLLFSATIGGSLQLILPRISPYVFRRVPSPLNWVLLLSVMMAMAAIGSAVSIVVVAYVGWLPAASAWNVYLNALRVSLAITLTFGVGITLYERLRHRADAAELALRTKERDEAEARRAATEARLASLESRVQPHFLFNTLNSIAALIPDDPVGAERMTGQLASLLRSSLDTADTPLVALAQELRSVRDYLEIERVRFGERLRYDIELSPALDHVLVPRFALQTLVENCVKYAVSPRREGGSIRVFAGESEDGSVRFTVEDDGPGFDASAAQGDHGLALLRERVHLSFGERAALRVDSQPGRTRVTLEVPR